MEAVRALDGRTRQEGQCEIASHAGVSGADIFLRRDLRQFILPGAGAVSDSRTVFILMKAGMANARCDKIIRGKTGSTIMHISRIRISKPAPQASRKTALKCRLLASKVGSTGRMLPAAAADNRCLWAVLQAAPLQPPVCEPQLQDAFFACFCVFCDSSAVDTGLM